MTEAGWMLDPQLQGDTSPIGDFALCRVLAINNADYPWLILVPRHAGVREIFELGPADCARLMEEIALASMRAESGHRLARAQYRSDRQCGGAAARPHRRAVEG